MAKLIGKPIKLDMNTLKADRGRFARICVELDLEKPDIGRINLENHWYQVEYELAYHLYEVRLLLAIGIDQGNVRPTEVRC